jgi:hypothetical protein
LHFKDISLPFDVFDQLSDSFSNPDIEGDDLDKFFFSAYRSFKASHKLMQPSVSAYESALVDSSIQMKIIANFWRLPHLEMTFKFAQSNLDFLPFFSRPSSDISFTKEAFSEFNRSTVTADRSLKIPDFVNQEPVSLNRFVNPTSYNYPDYRNRRIFPKDCRVRTLRKYDVRTKNLKISNSIRSTDSKNNYFYLYDPSTTFNFEYENFVNPNSNLSLNRGFFIKRTMPFKDQFRKPSYINRDIIEIKPPQRKRIRSLKKNRFRVSSKLARLKEDRNKRPALRSNDLQYRKEVLLDYFREFHFITTLNYLWDRYVAEYFYLFFLKPLKSFFTVFFHSENIVTIMFITIMFFIFDYTTVFFYTYMPSITLFLDFSLIGIESLRIYIVLNLAFFVLSLYFTISFFMSYIQVYLSFTKLFFSYCSLLVSIFLGLFFFLYPIAPFSTFFYFFLFPISFFFFFFLFFSSFLFDGAGYSCNSINFYSSKLFPHQINIYTKFSFYIPNYFLPKFIYFFKNSIIFSNHFLLKKTFKSFFFFRKFNKFSVKNNLSINTLKLLTEPFYGPNLYENIDKTHDDSINSAPLSFTDSGVARSDDFLIHA